METRSPRAARVRPATADARRTLAQEALAIIDREFADDLRLDAVARRIATSSRALQRCLLESAGTTFRRELKRRRLQEAAVLLRSTALPVAAVASRVGYRAPEQLSRHFRAEVGMTPTAYRRHDTMG